MQWPGTQQHLEEDGITVRDALQWISGNLAQNNFENPNSNAEQLLCWVLSCRRVDLHLAPDRRLAHNHILTLKESLRRRLAHTPLQYITGTSQFLDFDLTVNDGVFIPRPETEILVEETIKKLRTVSSIDDRDIFIDMCTGCGNVAVALAKTFPTAHVYATDISSEALSVAEENCEMYGLSQCISFLCGDLFKPLQGIGIQGNVKAVVCNPPYIVTSEIENLAPEVRDFEPRLALYGGEDGLDVLRRVIVEAPLFLRRNGLLALEVGWGQAPLVRQRMIDAGDFKEIELIEDLSGIERVVLGRVRGTSTDRHRFKSM
ncbi:MAG: peptide chain release factor N(5)-glutamine methyltransferase [Gemmatimonadota bacterium]|nr:MAG: peptide chain release factor N(5)-glutamine methyltransferase [Gemmatimonadota bacterium]